MNKEELSAGYKVTIAGGATNIGLAVIKGFAGVTGGSVALVADAIHSISDLATDIVVFFSLKIASQGADEDHPYGHGRAETIGGAIIGASIFFVGIGIGMEVFSKSLSGEISSPTQIAIWGAFVSIVANELLYQYTVRIGKKNNSESIIANAWHHRSDAISSIAAIIGIIGAYMGYSFMDPLAAILVAVMIGYVGWKIFYEAVQNLMDRGVSVEELDKMRGIIENDTNVLDYHELKTRKVGKDTFVDVHIQVPPRISVSEAHNIAESIRLRLRRGLRDVADALVHIDAEEDLEGRLYNVSRGEVESLVFKAVEATPELEIDGDITLHFLLHQVCVDVPVKSGDNLSVGEVKAAAGRLVDKMLDNELITEAVVKHNLGVKKVKK